jgi:hypothetical protein
MLAYRTEMFESVPRHMDAIIGFKKKVATTEVQDRPYVEFHHCPYVGFIGKHRSRVGCLLHPLADGNHGVDFRGLSYYGGMACNVYFCPSCRGLPAVYKEILRKVSRDWYLYGLVITETEMVKTFFKEVERRLRRSLKKEDILGNKPCMEVIGEFLNLKLDWPYRSVSYNGPLNYFFKDQKYSPPAIRHDNIGEARSKYDPILRALNTSIDSGSVLPKAECAIEQLVARLHTMISK